MAPTDPTRVALVQGGDILRRKRERIGWSVHTAAARLGITEATLQAHEDGLPIPRERYLRIARIYARAFHVLTQGLARQTKGVFR